MSGFAEPPAGSALLTFGRAFPLRADAVSFLVSALLVRSLPHLTGRVASTSPMPAMCAARVGAVLGGRLATAYDRADTDIRRRWRRRCGPAAAPERREEAVRETAAGPS